MARPAGRLTSLLQTQSAAAKAAIEAHLAPAVAKGSVGSNAAEPIFIANVTLTSRRLQCTRVHVQDLIADHASGSWVWTVGGKKVLDFGCGEALYVKVVHRKAACQPCFDVHR